MATFQRETRVAAPLDRVWAFHAAIDGLRAVTPRWLHLRVERVCRPEPVDPDGSVRADAGEDAGADADRGPGAGTEGTLVAGTQVTLSVRPFGLGARRSWVSEITACGERDGVAFLRDEMRQGPLREWRHTHRFEASGGGTLLRDRVEFETGFGPPADAAVKLGLAATFADRHRRTRKRLE